jgi:hypothetical protein
MLRKNVAGQFVHIAAVNASTGAALTGATISMRRCLDGTFAAGGATITEDTGLGFYKVALTQADTNGNDIGYFFTATSMIPVQLTCITTAADPTDTVRFGLTALPNAAAGANTGLPVVGTQIPNATAGASGGVLISGSNSGTTTLGALTVTGATTLTGNVAMSAGLNITQSSSNTSALVITGNGTGSGAVITSGSGLTGDGVQMTSASTNGNGLVLTKTGTGLAFKGATTDLTLAKTTNITGFNDIAATAIVSSGAITTSGGAVSTVSNVSTVTGLTASNLDTTISSRMATYTQPSGFLAATFPSGTIANTTNITAASGVAITSNIKQNQALAKFEFMMTDSTNHAPATGLAVTVTRSIDGGAFAAGTLSAVTEVANGIYYVDFGAGDLNGKVITLQATAAAADATFERIVTQV